MGVYPNHIGFPREGYTSIGWDTETVDGFPFTLQVSDAKGEQLWYLRPQDFLPRLLSWIAPLVRESTDTGRGVVLWAHNLGFDLPALLYPWAHLFASKEFQFVWRGVRLHVFYGDNPFVRLDFPGGGRAWMLDTQAFVPGSLKSAAEVFEIPFPKLAKPRGLGSRVLRTPEFERYAVRDAKIARLLGERLFEIHRAQDVALCFSVAHMSARVLCHHYVERPWRDPPPEVRDAALFSYHGGRNGFYVDPGWYKDVTEVDISSAYPWAMTRLPSFAAGHWERVRSIRPASFPGFYCVSGEVPTDEPYPLLYAHHGLVALRGSFSGVWTTSYELHESIHRHECNIREVYGYIWKQSTPTDYPLRQYVRTFYRLKQTSTGPMRLMFKLLLNSLYGKFIQLTPMDDGTEKPGAHFYPVAASFITALVRVRIHRLEHQYRALHVATDSLHTRARVRLPPGPVPLGGLERKMRGPLLLLRNKFYFHFRRDGRGAKVALHGVRAPARYVWNLLLAGKRSYKVKHMIRPKEAVRLRTRPLQFVARWFRIRIPGDPAIHPVPLAARRYWRYAQRTKTQTEVVKR